MGFCHGGTGTKKSEWDGFWRQIESPFVYLGGPEGYIKFHSYVAH